MICPCCGQLVTPPGRLQALMAEVGPVSAAILRELLAADGPLTGLALADRVYRGTRNGGPDHAQNVISIAVRRLKPRMESIGWTIHCKPWSGYRLVPVAVAAGA